ncbi:MAG: hypothetical protein ACOYOF_12105 [Verrucomicrobiaceae bacterium]
MDNRQLNRLQMHLTTRDVLDLAENRALWNANKGFALIEGQWRDQVRLLETHAVVQGAPLTGIRASKIRATDLLLDITMEVAGALIAYALVTRDDTLRAKADFTRPQLAALRDTEIDDRAQSIHDLAAPLLAAPLLAAPQPAAGAPTPWLPDFLSDSAAKLKSLAARITAYSLLVVSPTSAVARRKTVTDAIPIALRRADELLDDGLDRLMLQWKDSHRTFYNAYQNARQVIERGNRSTPAPEPTETTKP